MDLKTHHFPEMTELDMAFPAICTNPALLAEAKARGFYGGRTPYNALFLKLFYNGGSMDLKHGLDPKFKEAALPYLKAFMDSFNPKYEDKAAISALLLSELCIA